MEGKMSNVINVEMIIYDLYLSYKRDLLLYSFSSKREYANPLCHAMPIKTTTHPTPSRYAFHDNNPSPSTISSNTDTPNSLSTKLRYSDTTSPTPYPHP